MLLETLGNDTNNLLCNGLSPNTNYRGTFLFNNNYYWYNKILLDALDLLQSCETEIELACTPSVNVSADSCNIISNDFVDAYDKCGDDYEDEPQAKCNCITALSGDYVDVSACKAQSASVFRTSNTERNQCNKIFPSCKSMIPIVLEAVLECKSTFSRSSTCGCAADNFELLDNLSYEVLDVEYSTMPPGNLW